MEPDTERGWFPVGVERLERHDQTGLSQCISDLEVELPLVSGLGTHRARERDRRWVVCDQGPVQPAHQPMDRGVPTDLVERCLTVAIPVAITTVGEPVGPRREHLSASVGGPLVDSQGG